MDNKPFLPNDYCRLTMTRSTRQPYITITPKWDKHNEHSYRRRVKQQLQQFDPDADWNEVNLSVKDLEDYGTRCGFDVPSDILDEDYEAYQKAKRK